MNVFIIIRGVMVYNQCPNSSEENGCDPIVPGSKKHILCGTVGQTIEKILFNMADGGHFGFGALTDLARIFAKDMGAKIFI